MTLTITTLDYLDVTLKQEGAVRSLISNQQKAWAKVRGSSALAIMVAEGYVAIKKLIQNASVEAQAKILDEHGVSPATGDTSVFTPWIKVIWGEQHLDAEQTFVDAQGIARRKWVPDRSMEIYFHTMEELDRLGVNASHADVIMEHGGALAMARKRQKRLAEENKPSREQVQNEQRELFLEETKEVKLVTDLPLPDDAGEYITILCRKNEDGSLVALGVADKNAGSVLSRVAKEQFDELKARKKKQADDALREAALKKSMAKETEKLTGGMNKEERIAMIERLAKAAFSSITLAEPQKAVG